jgi:hypothetical protein
VAAELAAEGYGSGFIQIVRQRTISPSLYLTEKQYTALKRAARK